MGTLPYFTDGLEEMLNIYGIAHQMTLSLFLTNEFIHSLSILVILAANFTFHPK